MVEDEGDEEEEEKISKNEMEIILRHVDVTSFQLELNSMILLKQGLDQDSG